MAASSVCLVGSRPRRSIITGKLPCGSPPPHYVEKLDSAEAIQNQQDLKLSTADCQQVFPSARCDSAGCQMKRKTAVLTNGSGPTIRESHCGSTNTGGNAAVASMAAVSLASAVGAVLSLQLLVGFANHPDGVKEEPEVTRRREILGELGASLCGFSLAFSLSSLLVALLHLQFLLSEK